MPSGFSTQGTQIMALYLDHFTFKKAGLMPGFVT